MAVSFQTGKPLHSGFENISKMDLTGSCSGFALVRKRVWNGKGSKKQAKSTHTSPAHVGPQVTDTLICSSKVRRFQGSSTPQLSTAIPKSHQPSERVKTPPPAGRCPASLCYSGTREANSVQEEPGHKAPPSSRRLRSGEGSASKVLTHSPRTSGREANHSMTSRAN